MEMAHSLVHREAWPNVAVTKDHYEIEAPVAEKTDDKAIRVALLSAGWTRDLPIAGAVGLPREALDISGFSPLRGPEGEHPAERSALSEEAPATRPRTLREFDTDIRFFDEIIPSPASVWSDWR